MKWLLFFCLSASAFSSEFECKSSDFISAPNARIDVLETLVQISLSSSERMTLRAVFRALADSQWTQGLNQTPGFSSQIKRLLTHSYSNPGTVEPPINLDVKKVFEDYLTMAVKNNRPEICQVALDAATYFALVGAGNLSILFKSYLTRFNCPDAFNVPSFP